MAATLKLSPHNLALIICLGLLTLCGEIVWHAQSRLLKIGVGNAAKANDYRARQLAKRRDFIDKHLEKQIISG